MGQTRQQQQQQQEQQQQQQQPKHQSAFTCKLSNSKVCLLQLRGYYLLVLLLKKQLISCQIDEAPDNSAVKYCVPKLPLCSFEWHLGTVTTAAPRR
jgi:membrane protease subunit (stomatin/prohibitin family)